VFSGAESPDRNTDIGTRASDHRKMNRSPPISRTGKRPVVVSTHLAAVPNAAVTVRSCDMSSTQSSVPTHAPLHPANTEPPLGVATSRMAELLG
jgi:hypothetical protein